MSSLDWVASRMKLTVRAIQALEEGLKQSKLDRASALLCSHVEWKFTYFAKLLAGVLDVTVVGNRTTTCRPECVEELRRIGIDVFDSSGLSDSEHADLLKTASGGCYTFVFDDGAKVIPSISSNPFADKTIAATEYTMSGIRRLQGLEGLSVPIYDLNSSFTKNFIGNLYGAGISTLNAFLSVTNIAPSGLRVGVVGYGSVGQSVARAFSGAGSIVAVCDSMDYRHHMAKLDGFDVSPVERIVGVSDLVITCTGSTRVIGNEHFSKMADGTIMANVGHDNLEIAVDELSEQADRVRSLSPHIDEYTMGDGRRVVVLCNGTLLNLSAGSGFPIDIIDHSLAAAAALWGYAIFSKAQRVGLNAFPTEVEDRIKSWLTELSPRNTGWPK